jgi:hypothetical protein
MAKPFKNDRMSAAVQFFSTSAARMSIPPPTFFVENRIWECYGVNLFPSQQPSDESPGHGRVEEDQMDNWTFGLTMLIVGMGGTLAALGALALMMGLLKKLFPVKEESN